MIMAATNKEFTIVLVVAGCYLLVLAVLSIPLVLALKTLNKMKSIKLALADIKLGNRTRQDLGDLDDLAESIQRYGLIEPVVINQDHTLVAGGRRLAACQQLGWAEIDVVYRETLSEDELKEIELEENVRRKDITWQERVLSIDTIHRLKVNRAALDSKTWGMRETGALFNMALCKVGYATQIATYLRANDEELRTAPSLRDALNVLLKRREQEANARLAESTIIEMPQASPAVNGIVDLLDVAQEQPIRHLDLASFLHHADAIEFMSTMEDGAVDHVVTDPPYGLDPDLMEQSGTGMDMSTVKDEHQVEENLQLLSEFLPEAYRVTKPNGFCVLWYDLDHHEWLSKYAKSLDWNVQRWPLTWIKLHQCMNQASQYNFTKTVEFAMVLRKPGSTLVSQQNVCHFADSSEQTKARLGSHPFIKPIAVWQWIMNAVALPGQTILEPFAGHGSCVVSAIEAGYKVIGVEKKKIHYDKLIENVKQTYANLYSGKVEFK